LHGASGQPRDAVDGREVRLFAKPESICLRAEDLEVDFLVVEEELAGEYVPNVPDVPSTTRPRRS